MAIYIKAFFALVSQFFHKAAIPFLDAVLGYGGLAAISYFWGHGNIYGGVGTYPTVLFAVVLPVYILIWLLSSDSMIAKDSIRLIPSCCNTSRPF